MKSLQPFLQTRAFDFWALLLSTNEVESSRSLLVPKLRAESLLLRAFGVGYIKRIQKWSKLFTIYQSMVTATLNSETVFSSHWEIFPCFSAPSEPNPSYFFQGELCGKGLVQPHL